MSLRMDDVPAPAPSRALRIAGKVFLAALGLVIGAIAGVVIAFMVGWLGPISC